MGREDSLIVLLIWKKCSQFPLFSILLAIGVLNIVSIMLRFSPPSSFIDTFCMKGCGSSAEEFSSFFEMIA